MNIMSTVNTVNTVDLKSKDKPIATRYQSRTFGSILIEQGRLSPTEAEDIQRFASASGLRFGDAALQLNLLTPSDIDLALAYQYDYPVLQRGGTVADEVVAAHSPELEEIESLRTIRSQLEHLWFGDSNSKVLTITSPQRGEGRSWLTANLATLFAQTGVRTLLIDADMRHPRQHTLFKLNNAVGLSSLLTGRGSKEATVRVHPQLRLFVLPAGISPPNPQELLARPVFELVLQRFTEQFDVILIDTPAATEVSDAQIVARRSGAALMVARRHHTRHSRLMTTMRSFSQTGVKVIGTVVNEY
jgi:protein-tyrosine kinase